MERGGARRDGVRAQTTVHSPLLLAAFARFALVSGLGWLLDLAVLAALTSHGGWPPFAANIVSSSLAAGTVFLVTRKRVHAGADGALSGRVAAYLLYTLLVILLASAAMEALAPRLAAATSHETAVLLAKALVTPPQLLCNFLVSRLIARFALGAPRAAAAEAR